MSNLLFVCSKNKWRSPTAELLFKKHCLHSARSAGISDKARVKVNQKMIDQTDVIFVMERKHQQRLKLLFPVSLSKKPLIVLDIQD